MFRVAFLGVILASGGVAHLFYAQDFSFELTQWIIGGLFFTGLSYTALRVFSRFLKTNAWSQVLWDLLFASFVVLQTGSVFSAFVLIYALYVMTAAVMLMSRGAIFASILSVLSFLSVCWLSKDFSSLDIQIVSRILFVASDLLLLGGVIAYMVRNKENLRDSLEKTSHDLKDLSARYLAIIENIPSGIIYIDKDSLVLYANRASQEILDQDLSGVFLDGSFLEPLLKQEGRAESEVILANHKKCILGHHRTELPNKDQILLFQDLTKIRLLEKEILVKDKMATVGQLAAGMAHEIRNPLASLSGSIQVLQQEIKDDTSSKKLMSIVIRESDRLDHLVNDFLNYAKPSMLRLVRFNLKMAIDEILDSYRSSQDPKFNQVTYLLDSPENLIVEWDRDKLSQILVNLINNAVEACTLGGVVQIKVIDFDTKVELNVLDTGHGMNPSVRARLFDPFFTQKEGGIGLGMALVYEMVKAHCGSIRVESDEGQGCQVKLEFPKEGIYSVNAA